MRLLATLLAATAVPLLPVGPLPAQAGRVYLARHAEKVDASRDPELSATGMARSIALTAALAEEPLTAIVVSQFRRTAMTAAPLAAAMGIPMRVVPVRGTPADYADTVAAVIDAMPPASSVLVVGHSNTLAPLIARLGGPVLADLCDPEYARLFVLDRRDGDVRLAERTYGVTDTDGAADCRRAMRLDARQPPSPTGAPHPMPSAASLRDLVGDWAGENKLWFMPDAPVHESATTATIRTVAGDRYLVIDYTWSHEGKPHDGHLVLRLADDLDPADMVWVDAFHQSATIMLLAGEAKSDSAVTARGSYPAPTGPDWGWKIAVSAESADRYVMRMWNITPDGQEALAVEAVYTRR